MRILIHHRMRVVWFALTGVVATSLLIPGATLHDPWITDYVNSDWIHFILYAAVGAIAILAWKPRYALAVSVGVGVTSIGLQFLRGILNRRGIDADGTVINLLGVIAGVLVGFHLRHSSWLVRWWNSQTAGQVPPSVAIPDRVLRPETPGSGEPLQQTLAPHRTTGYSERFRLRSAEAKLKD